jgi:DNA-binding GntR family transcriptional regulator
MAHPVEQDRLTIQGELTIRTERTMAYLNDPHAKPREAKSAEAKPMQKIIHSTLNEKAYAEIKRSIMSGMFLPGQTLTIRGLADDYGISATPIREALRGLVAEGALVTLSNRSIMVPTMTGGKFEELRLIRVALEGLCAELAAPRIRGHLLRSLAAQHLRMEAAVASDDVRDYMRLNEEFHFNIYRAAGRDTLFAYIENLWLRVGPYMTLLFKSSGFYEEATLAHGRILDALRARDAVAAREAVQADIDGAARHLVAQFTD